MAKAYGFPAKDVARIGKAVREIERAPARRPQGQEPAFIAPGRVVVCEIVSGPDGSGNYVVTIQERRPDGTWQDVSTMECTLEDLNA
jgi:hypothetical protein